LDELLKPDIRVVQIVGCGACQHHIFSGTCRCHIVIESYRPVHLLVFECDVGTSESEDGGVPVVPVRALRASADGTASAAP